MRAKINAILHFRLRVNVDRLAMLYARAMGNVSVVQHTTTFPIASAGQVLVVNGSQFAAP